MLSELAEHRFAPFSRAERELFRAAQKGGEASALAKNEHENDPAKAAKWSADRVVRAECIAWVCTDPQASNLVSYQGLDLRGMRIDGDLDLRKAKIDFFLSVQRCAFSGSILLQDSDVRGFSLLRCHLKSLNAEGAQIRGALCLKDGCKVDGEVSLLGVTIGRDLDCSGAQFSNLGADALSTDGGKIGGDVLLGDDFKAEGVVSLSGTTIGGNLDCSGGQFINPEDEALRAEGAKIEGDVLFKNNFDDELKVKSKFNVEGEVKLKGATIGGDLDCEHARFSNPKGDAITADILEVKGDVTFGAGFRADGQVRLFGAVIGGDLDCEGAEFINAEAALSCDGAKIEGDVKFSGGAVAKGRVGFSGATIGGNLDCKQTQLCKGEVERASDEDEEDEEDEEAFNAEGAKIEGTIFFGHRFEVEGEVRLIGATIGGDLDFRHAQFKAPEGDAISAHRAKIGGNVMFDNGFSATGAVRFLGTKIGGDLKCNKAEFLNPGDDAFDGVGAKIEGSIALGNSLKVKGCVNLSNTEVSRALELQGFAPSSGVTLDLRSAKVGTLQDDRARWKRTANLLLDGFSYERFQVEGTFNAADWIKRCDGQRRERQKPLLRRATKKILAVLLRTKQWLMSAAVRKKYRRRKEVRRKQFRPQPYEQLAAVLRKMGHEGDARRLMIAKNRDRARSTTFLHQSWWWYNFFGRFIGYGYAPWRAFAISLALILIGFGVFQCGYQHGLVLPAKEGAYAIDSNEGIQIPMPGRKLSKDYPAFNAFVYSLESFTPLLKLDQTANWAPNANSHAGGLLRSYLYCHIVAGWLLTSLWVGAVTGLVKN